MDSAVEILTLIVRVVAVLVFMTIVAFGAPVREEAGQTHDDLWRTGQGGCG